MRRSARVLQAEIVNVPNSNEPALRVITDFAVKTESEFYLRADSPKPEFQGVIVYGDRHAWYSVGGQQVEARKVEGNDDPGAPLR